MPDNKQKCRTCKQRHLPPTGKKCQFGKEQGNTDELLRDAAVSSDATGSQSTPLGDIGGQQIQKVILEQLRRVTERLDSMEDRMASTSRTSTPELSTDSFLESVKPRKKSVKPCKVLNDSSSDDSDIPTLEMLRSQKLQKKVDKRIRELDQSSHFPGNDEKFKSQRGGGVDVPVKRKVQWPHEAILGGVARQRITYDQLSLTQWVQGFCKNILEQKSSCRRDTMVSYLSDLMEDATDFSWQGAKAAHAVLLCEMERGSLTWENGERIDRIRRAHAQKHVPSRQAWGKSDTKKPWFCKNFQNNTCSFQKDHESNGRLQRHICAFCLTQGKQLGHAEKNCQNKTKNENPAVHH